MAKTITPKVWSLGVDSSGRRRSKPPEDVTPPTVPGLVEAAAQSTTSILVTCALSTDDQSGVREYIIEYRVSGVGSYVEHGRAPEPTGLSVVSYIADGLTSATNYDFRVRAVDASSLANVSGPSAVVTRMTMAGATPGTFAPTYPRLGLCAIAGNQSYPVSWATAYGKFDAYVMGGGWEGWATGKSYTREDFVVATRSASIAPSGTKGLQYVNGNEYDPNIADSGRLAGYVAQIVLNNWELRNAGTSGAYTPSNYRPTYRLNNYAFGPPNAAGRTPYQEFAYYLTQLYRGENGSTYHPGMRAPSLDGVFLDNCLLDPQTSTAVATAGDWNRDGTGDPYSLSTVAQWLTAGQRQFVETSRALWPSGKYVTGNCGDFGRLQTAANMAQMLNGGMYEGAMGEQWSMETYNFFAGMMGAYRRIVDACIAPKLVFFVCRIPSATSYQFARYAMTAALMDDGLATLTRGDGSNRYSSDPATHYVCDEMMGGTINARGYLGNPVTGSDGARQTAARYYAQTVQGTVTGGGVWRRDFDNGIVLCGARDGIGGPTHPLYGDQTTPYASISLGGTFYKLRGVYDTVYNDASPVTSIVVPKRGGVILMRTPT